MRLALLALAAVAVAGPGCGGWLGNQAPPEPGPLSVTPLEDRAAVDGSSSDLPEADLGNALENVPRGAPRATVVPRAFRVATLPVASIPAALRNDDAPRALPAGRAPPELVARHHQDADYDLSLQLPRRALGRLRVAETDSRSTLGLRVKCGEPRLTVAPVRLEIVQRLERGGGRYEIVDAWFDAATCTAVEVRRTQVDLASVLGRLLYAFRECGATCDEQQSVTLLGPALRVVTASSVGVAAKSASPLPFGRVTLDLAAGGGSSLSARIDSGALDDWYGGTPPSWARGARQLAVGVDIAQSGEDPEPVAVAYVGVE